MRDAINMVFALGLVLLFEALPYLMLGLIIGAGAWIVHIVLPFI